MKSGVQPWIGWGWKAGWLAAGAPPSPRSWGCPLPTSWAVGGLAEDDLRFRTLPAEHAADAGQRAASAVAGHEVVEPVAPEIGDDLPCRGVLMNSRVGFGLELAGEEPAIGIGELLGLHVHSGALCRSGREDDLRAEEAHQLASLDGEAVGHGHDQRIALRSADHRQADAGVAAGGFDDRLTGLERAAPLGLLDDADRQAILDRSRRVEEFRLHVEADMAWSEVPDPDARRVADRIEDAVVEASASTGGPRFR